ncbi:MULTISPECIES: AAC(3) family N-acetyltransferase [Haloferacaceae]|uniref:AAC(3) family N-acetyltransferase n=1 Tax=Halorubrum glutamatedens TaxID=2707018 RepID=A0ABD5QSE2_9EURY|nr:AAC(3) family N-acetyltransferase [Halobellus captivus]
MITKAQVYANTANYFFRSKLRQSEFPIPVGEDVGPVREDQLDAVLSQYDDEVVFVHVGLSDIKTAFQTDPYHFLLSKLDSHFESVLAPGFTPSFRSSGIYHKEYSKPEYGTFSRLFLNDANYRTDDAIHSILVRGDYRFSQYDHHDSFGEDGCWSKLDEENVLYMNIGTPWIVSTQHHYIEHKADVPYLERSAHEGVIYYDETDSATVTQYNYRYDDPSKRSARKIAGYLRDQDVLSSYRLNGLKIRFFRAGDLRRSLMHRIESNPYYLIT